MKELEYKALVLSEVALVKHSDNVMFVHGVFLHYVLQVLSLLVGKLVVHFSVSCYFKGKDRLIFLHMVLHLHYLGKRSFAQDFHHFVSVRNMVPYLNS